MNHALPLSCNNEMILTLLKSSELFRVPWVYYVGSLDGSLFVKFSRERYLKKDILHDKSLELKRFTLESTVEKCDWCRTNLYKIPWTKHHRNPRFLPWGLYFLTIRRICARLTAREQCSALASITSLPSISWASTLITSPTLSPTLRMQWHTSQMHVRPSRAFEVESRTPSKKRHERTCTYRDMFSKIHKSLILEFSWRWADVRWTHCHTHGTTTCWTAASFLGDNGVPSSARVGKKEQTSTKPIPKFCDLALQQGPGTRNSTQMSCCLSGSISPRSFGNAGTLTWPSAACICYRHLLLIERNQSITSTRSPRIFLVAYSLRM